MDPAALDVIVLNWRTPEMSAECARLAAESLPGAKIIIVDNGSGDGSPARLRAAAPFATIVENSENLGFGGGFNTGLQAGRNPFVLTLNSDVRPVGAGYQRLLDHCSEHPRLGAVTPQTVDSTGRQRAQMPAEPPAWRLVAACVPFGWRVMSPQMYAPAPGPPQVINWLPGLCATLFRRDALEGVGAFDPGYFLGWEEYDLTRRLRAAHWDLAFHPQAEVIHEGHGSTPKTLSAWRAKHGRAALCYHLQKHHGPGWHLLARAAAKVADVYTDLRSLGRSAHS